MYVLYTVYLLVFLTVAKMVNFKGKLKPKLTNYFRHINAMISISKQNMKNRRYI